MRFPGFEGEWQKTMLRETCNIQRGGSPRPILNFISNSKDAVNWIKISDVDIDGHIWETQERIKPEGVKYSRRVYKGDLLLSNSMSFGVPYILEVDGCIHDGWLVIQPFNKEVNLKFLYQYLSCPWCLNQYKRLAAGGVVNNLNKDLVSSIRLSLPEYLEQNKISEFLALLDERISAQRKTIEDYENLQKALLKAKLEVADLSISNIVKKVSSNLSLSGNQGKEGFPLIGVEGVVGKVSSPLINQPGILVVKDGAGIGKSFIPAENKFSFLSTLICLIPDNKYTANEILFCLKRLNLKSYSVGSGIPHIYFKDFANLKVPTRNNKFLQVSSTYKLLSNKINMEKKIVKEALLLKKYLLMNLFI